MESMTALEFANATALVRAISDAMRSLDGVLHKGKLITAETQAIGSQVRMGWGNGHGGNRQITSRRDMERGSWRCLQMEFATHAAFPAHS